MAGTGAHSIGGLLRRVEVFALPEVHIAELYVTTALTPDYRDAALCVRTRLVNEGSRREENLSLRYQLWDPDGMSVALTPSSTSLVPVDAAAKQTVDVAIPIDAPRMWDPEHPHLYTLEIEVVEGGTACYSVRQRVGFRQVEVHGEQVLVNGRPIKIRGICDLGIHPTLGRAVPPEQCRRDAELLRDANINLVRHHIAPPDEAFLDACDELGVFVEVEHPFCWVGHVNGNAIWDHEDCQSLTYEPLILRGTVESVVQTRHHPCVLFWSLANESEWGPSFAKAMAYERQLDPTRPEAFTGGETRMGTSIADDHYPGVTNVVRRDPDGRP